MTVKEWRESMEKENVNSNVEAGVGRMYSDYMMMGPPGMMGSPNGMGWGGGGGHDDEWL